MTRYLLAAILSAGLLAGPAWAAARGAGVSAEEAAKALDSLAAQAEGRATLSADEAAQAADVVRRAARALPAGDTVLLPRLRSLRDQRRAGYVPTAQKPLKADRPLDRLLLALDLDELKGLSPAEVRAYPSAEAFPGAVARDAPRVSRTVEIDTRVPAWHSTGLYAAPGEVVTVTLPASAADKGLDIRIGAHKDSLWRLDAWKRPPEITVQIPLKAAMTPAACAFGGPVYVVVPSGCTLGTVAVQIAGAVEAPHFVLGKTPPAAWRETIRLRPAPWAELEGRKAVLTLPAKVVQALDDPEALMAFWDSVIDACSELAACPLERERPERYVADVQISAGYMHAGYPIMLGLDVPPVMVDKARMMKDGHGGVWGFWHETGHNFQVADWTFAGTGEVTVNLFSMYVFEKVCRNTNAGMGRVGRETPPAKIKAYLAAGADFEKWKADPFLGLVMYAQIQQAFGWDAYKKVFAEYRALPAAERPKSDDEKRDQWLVRLSRAVGRNLGPFFQAWGVPTSPAARAGVANLPAWMPEGFPPK